MDDLYVILGVDSGANLEAIQERFRFLAQAFHPDKYSSTKQKQLAEEEFKKINNAYQILSNPRKRMDYDLQKNKITNYSRANTDDLNRKAEEMARQRAWEKKKEEEERNVNREHLRKKHANAKWYRTSAITSSEIAKAWILIIHSASAIPNANHLDALLNSVKTVELQGNTLILAFGSEVVKSKMTPEWKELTRQLVFKVFGTTLDIQCVIAK